MLIRSATTIVLALSLVTCASTGPASCAKQSYSFDLWGDMPYKKAGDDPKLLAVLKSVNDADVAFSLYDGDTKDGSSKCTDFHRTNNGGYNGLERLAHLCKVLFPSLYSPGQGTGQTNAPANLWRPDSALGPSGG